MPKAAKSPILESAAQPVRYKNEFCKWSDIFAKSFAKDIKVPIKKSFIDLHPAPFLAAVVRIKTEATPDCLIKVKSVIDLVIAAIDFFHENAFLSTKCNFADIRRFVYDHFFIDTCPCKYCSRLKQARMDWEAEEMCKQERDEFSPEPCDPDPLPQLIVGDLAKYLFAKDDPESWQACDYFF